MYKIAIRQNAASDS